MLREQNFYEVFSLKPKFDINKTELKENYYKLSKKYHPDISKSKHKFQTILNAYETLKDDFLRAKYLKKLSCSGNLNNKPISKNFLNDIFLIEEKIEEAQRNELEKIIKFLDDKILECKLNYFNRDYLNKWSYYNRLKDICIKKMDSCDDKE